MSRIGRQPVVLPAGVQVTLGSGVVSVTGPKGSLSQAIPAPIGVSISAGEVLVTRPSDIKQHKALHGLARTLVSNMVIG